MNEDGELRWAVKDSFLHYVRVLAAGVVDLSDGAAEAADGTFSWPLRSARREDGSLFLGFGGSVRFTAHAGYLDVDLRDPWLLLTPDGGTLSITAEGGSGRTVIAVFDPGSGAEDEGTLVPLLTTAGVELFGSVYAEGVAFAPLSARIHYIQGDGSDSDRIGGATA